MRHHKIAVIPGDGVGIEVIDATLPVLERISGTFGFTLELTNFDWSCDYYLQHGRMMPKDGIERIRAFDAILLGAVGWPARVADDV